MDSDVGKRFNNHGSITTQEMKLVVPNSQRINRGGMVLSELVETCRCVGAAFDFLCLFGHILFAFWLGLVWAFGLPGLVCAA